MFAISKLILSWVYFELAKIYPDKLVCAISSVAFAIEVILTILIQIKFAW